MHRCSVYVCLCVYACKSHTEKPPHLSSMHNCRVCAYMRRCVCIHEKTSRKTSSPLCSIHRCRVCCLPFLVLCIWMHVECINALNVCERASVLWTCANVHWCCERVTVTVTVTVTGYLFCANVHRCFGLVQTCIVAVNVSRLRSRSRPRGIYFVQTVLWMLANVHHGYERVFGTVSQVSFVCPSCIVQSMYVYACICTCVHTEAGMLSPWTLV
jgi:hypothetical protein